MIVGISNINQINRYSLLNTLDSVELTLDPYKYI